MKQTYKLITKSGKEITRTTKNTYSHAVIYINNDDHYYPNQENASFHKTFEAAFKACNLNECYNGTAKPIYKTKYIVNLTN